MKPYQIIVYVSISLRSVLECDSRVPRLPAILDTGNNHNLAISRGQLIQWAGLHPEALRPLGTLRDRQQLIPVYDANIWLHANVPGRQEVRTGEPFLLSVDDGTAVYPDETGPRLPILGLRALTRNQLQLAIDGERCEVSLRTPNWITRLSGWVSQFR